MHTILQKIFSLPRVLLYDLSYSQFTLNIYTSDTIPLSYGDSIFITECIYNLFSWSLSEVMLLHCYKKLIQVLKTYGYNH
jgi:hypothetical protein